MRARWKSGLRLFRRDESVKFRGTVQNRLEKKLFNKQSRQSLSALIADADLELNELPYECYYDEDEEVALEELEPWYSLEDEGMEDVSEDDVTLLNPVINDYHDDYNLASCFD